MLGRSDAFCPACGARRAEGVGKKPKAVEGGSSRRWWIIGGAGAAIVLAAIAAGVLAWMALRGNSHKGFATRARTILQNVYPRQQTVTMQMRRLYRAKSLTPLTGSARRLSTASLRAQGQVASLSAGNKTEEGQKASLLRALRSQTRYANELIALPPINKLSLGTAQNISDQAQQSRSAYRPLASTVGHLVIKASPPAPIPLARLAKRVQTQRAKAHARSIKLRAFVIKVEGFLSESANGRSEIISAIADTQNCSISPEDSANRVDSVVRNRQSVLDQLSALNPPNPQADHVASLLESGLEHSIEADRHYRDWMNFVFDYYYTPPEGCFGSPPENQDFKDGQSESATATSYKNQFVQAFNPLAKKFHQRKWAEPEF